MDKLLRGGRKTKLEYLQGKLMNITDTRDEKIEGSAMESLKMNPFSFIQMSGSFNFFVYGIFVPLIIVGAGFLTGHPQAGVVGMLIAVVMSLASIVRRGMDAGNTPMTTILTLALTSWIISFILEKTLISFKILFISEHLWVGMVLLAIVQNIYLVYLLFAPQKEMKKVEANKMGQRIILGVTIVLILGILAAVALPRLQ